MSSRKWFSPEGAGICVFSHGQGQDSAAILALLTDPERPDFRERYVGKRTLVILHADTGNEHPETIAYREWTRAFCEAHGIIYEQIAPDAGYNTGAWRGGLVGQFTTNSTIGSVAFPSTCSDQLKVSPIWNRVNEECALVLGVSPARKGGVKAYVSHFEEQVPVIIGFAAGEDSRISQSPQMELLPAKKARRPWYAKCVRPVYPLIDIGMDRMTAQAYLRSRKLPVPRPSLCRFCHWKSPQELLHFERTDPKGMQQWLALEQRKIETWAPRTAQLGKPNHGVKGNTTLAIFLEEARRKFGRLTTEELSEYVMSHGHCVQSRY